MNLAILICTRNQADSLDRLLASLCKLHTPSGVSTDVIVVDNGSTDQTKTMLHRHQGSLNLKVVSEPRPGLSRARNTGIEHLNSDYLICTDDDATVPAGWLSKYADAFKRYPQASFFGSDVLPQLNHADPVWAKAALKAAPSCFANFTVGTQDKALDASTAESLLPFGVNMAFRVQDLKKFRFDENMGRQPGGIMLSGEETKLLSEMVKTSLTGRLIADNPVLHWIAPERQTIEFVRTYYHGQGWQQGVEAAASGTAARLLNLAGARLAGPPLAAAGFAGKLSNSQLASIWLERQKSHFSGRLKGLLQPMN